MPKPPAALRARIENAAEVIGRVWPLQTFNSANPLSGFEDQPFDEAIAEAQALFGGRGYPRASVFRKAWERGAIDPGILRKHLSEHGFRNEPAALLDQMAAGESAAPSPNADPAEDTLNRTLTHWLAAFLDQGQAVWAMPNREDGFYAAWRAVAPYDDSAPSITHAADLPKTTADALEAALDGHPEATWEALFRDQFAALPGWVGFIKWRAQQADAWQSEAPITLADYLAVRLTLAQHLDVSVAPGDPAPARNADEPPPLAALWLRAWEESEHTDMMQRIREAARPASRQPIAKPPEASAPERPAAQLVFCIDVRSEVIRRHLEAVGPYETFGYAGFFGIPMQHERHDGVRVKACPPIVDPKHRIADRPVAHRHDTAERHDAWARWIASGRKVVKALKTNVAAAFGFVEGSGSFFGGAMAARTLLPAFIARLHDAWTDRVATPDDFCAPTVDRRDDPTPGLPVGLSHEAQVLYAETAFRLMGWERFAPIVVFSGHGSQTPNNPYKSSLDCGACAANPGGPNARVLATICNRPAVRDALQERGIDIPDDTVFLAGEHNTTTDAIRLFPDTVGADALPHDALSHDALATLRADLDEAHSRAADERIQTMNTAAGVSGRHDVRRRAADWAETRPEWGLAGNLGFVIGPRRLTDGISLDGRCFLHSYDWRTDDDGTALATIMTGPLVVGEWINMQYYFSTVDNAVYGSGSKITQNVVGTVGIVQGNGGDLMTGLPLQSLHTSDTEAYHRPLRLMALIHAPVGRVDQILRDNRALRQLFDHEWLALTVMDPTDGNQCLRYQPGGDWATALPNEASTPVLEGDGVPTPDASDVAMVADGRERPL